MDSEPTKPEDLRFELMLDRLLEGAAVRDLPPGGERSQEVLLQHKINAVLSRQYAPPEFQLKLPPLSIEPVGLAPKPSHAHQKTTGRLLTYLLAASLLVACAGLWGRQIVVMWREAEANRYESLPLASIYQSAVDSGFQPAWKCEDDKQFAETFAYRQDVPLFLASLPQGTSMLGLSYLQGFTPQGTVMLARVEGEPVMVLVDRTNRLDDIMSQPEPQGGLRRHVIELGPLTLIELSRADSPKVAPSLQILDSVPKSDTGRVPGEAPQNDPVR